MQKFSKLLKNMFISALCIGAALSLSLLMQKFLLNNALISAVFVLAIYLISLTTDGYLYGIISAIIAVLMINYAFTFPYFEFNFSIPENILSAVIMITVLVEKIHRMKSASQLHIEGNAHILRRMLVCFAQIIHDDRRTE